VNSATELKEWVYRGKCAAPRDYSRVTEHGVDLAQNETMELLFKFLTTREVTLSQTAKSSP
jgi:hypothetical protein